MRGRSSIRADKPTAAVLDSHTEHLTPSPPWTYRPAVIPMDESRRCTGKSKQSGSRCKRAASPGLDKCPMHSGLSKAERLARAAEEQARKAVVIYGLPRDISPTEALLEEVRYTAGHVAWLRERVHEIEQGDLVWGKTEEVDRGSGEFSGVDVTSAATPNVWLELYYRERKHLVDVTKAAISAGIEERRVKIAEAQGAMVAQMIRAILADLTLSPEQQARVPEIVPRHLRALAG